MMIRTLALLGLILLACRSGAAPPATEPYLWKNVQMVGTGFVDGIIFHPTQPELRYARTDMGGAYRWNPGTGQWDPMLDWLPYRDLNLMGVESIAVDAQDPDRLYLACGTYSNAGTPNGAVLRSQDRGHHFARSDVPFKFGGNENGRGNGERLAVDPHDGATLLLGTRHDGLWLSRDHAESWHLVDSFPSQPDDEGDGIVFVLFDPHQGQPGQASPVIYAGQSVVGRNSLFVSRDGGASWQPLPGQPTRYRPTRAALAADGSLYVAYGSTPGPSRMSGGAVWHYQDGGWHDITPDPDAGFGYVGVTVAASDPGVVMVTSFGRPGGDDIFRSRDFGAHWQAIFQSGGQFDPALAPYTNASHIHWLFDVEIDPDNQDHALFTTGYGGWESFDLTAIDRARPTHWQIMSTGIEQAVAEKLLSPTAGAALVSAIGDYGGFVHWDLDRPAPEGSIAPPRLSNTTGLAGAPLRPEIMVRVGDPDFGKQGVTLGFSLDGGRQWEAAGSMPRPDSRGGEIALSAEGDVWLWRTGDGTIWRSADRGDHWSAAQGIDPGARIVADPIDAKLFYGLSLFAGTLFISRDGGAHFQAQTLALPGGVRHPGHRGDSRGGQDQLYATPGRSGDLWLAAFDGLYHSTDRGAHFVALPQIEELHAFGFGKAADGAADAALYLVGTLSGQRGVFRSIDSGGSWVRINDDAHQWGLILQIAGDPKRFGRVYVGTHGRGVLYGDPVPEGERREQILQDGWRFHRGEIAGGESPNLDDGDWSRIALPHSFNARDGEIGGAYYRGPAWYRRVLTQPDEPPGRRIFLQFDGAALAADVWLNGRPVGRHQGGFASFRFDVTDLLQPGANLLAVRVDNGRNQAIAPLAGDFTLFGGLYRPVHLISTDPLHVDLLDYGGPGISLLHSKINAQSADITLAVRVQNDGDRAVDSDVVVSLQDPSDAEAAHQTVRLTAAPGVFAPVELPLTLSSPHLWDGRSDPFLYRLEIKLRDGDGVVRDRLVVPIGLRSLRVDPRRGLLLNDKPYRLYGVDLQHSSRPGKGTAVSQSDIDQDIAILSALGATGLRLAHYQHPARVYDDADRAGLLLWTEVPLTAAVDPSQEFADNIADQMRELIHQNALHPSVLLWGLGNEIYHADAVSDAVLARLQQTARETDPTRPTAYAHCCQPDDDPQTRHSDLIGYNRYFGWYSGELADFAAWADHRHQDSPQRGYAVSEYGAGASPWQQEDPPRRPRPDSAWHPEQYQSLYHEAAWRALRDRPDLWGSFVWVAFDFPSAGRHEGDRPGINDKGLVSFDRQTRKDAYFWYQANWSTVPMLHIAGRRLQSGRHATVKVYSNLDRLTLTVNGAPLGSRPVLDHVAEWTEIGLAPGENRIRVSGGALSDEFVWQR